jgi:hypothetical protein
MYFLLNDAVLHLGGEDAAPAAIAQRFAQISIDYVQLLGRELYAANPLVHSSNPIQATKLASLIVAKAPEVNAALFVSPGAGCSPDHVAVRFASVDIGIMANLYTAHMDGSLTSVYADREVWRRMAA